MPSVVDWTSGVVAYVSTVPGIYQSVLCFSRLMLECTGLLPYRTCILSDVSDDDEYDNWQADNDVLLVIITKMSMFNYII